ncbi:non-hydrolyzing UDP-N-acetylglucosamine 2-epimerase [Compostibacter hankyongensis]|uniref:UDP-N-acetylglucosamine 2-epimerase (Non-hydrolyzing) n=1 Tax=Compostibacter hankyongensis TaxID=1007089 RepID=A0ABP8FV13_9BACT
MKIITVLGARPQFVKAAVVSREIKGHQNIDEVILHTGQHFDSKMSDVFFEDLQIPHPNYNLAINNMGHGAMTGRMLEKIEEILLKEVPDWVLVYGDTNSTIAGALAASKLHIKLAHVESGLRSFNMKMPEEINRILTDRISDKLFCPTQTAVENLTKEGFENDKIRFVGDVMLDAVHFYREFAKKPLVDLPHKFALCTLHRAENTDDANKLNNIIKSLNEISNKLPIILPLHPRTRNKLSDIIIDKNIIVIDPVGYFEMLYLLEHAELVFTDSGGLQKEAFWFKRFCITLREETEWVELVQQGCNICVGAEPKKILEAFNHFIENKHSINYDKSLYGDGNAGKLIIQELINSQ